MYKAVSYTHLDVYKRQYSSGRNDISQARGRAYSSRSQKNVDVRQELNIMSIFDKIARYRLKWLEHLNRMDDCCISKQLRNYKPKGWRGVERPKEPWSNQFRLESPLNRNKPFSFNSC